MKLICVVGPTAVGKTGFAIELCKRINGEIIGVDASQIYRGMDIGTGKATAEELGEVKHHLIDVVDPDEPFDAARFVAMADEKIADCWRRGRMAVCCGGTGLYLRALLHGLCETPPVSADVSAALKEKIEQGGLAELYEELKVCDPEAAARLAPRDKQRIERALGVFRTTGKPISAWQAAHRFQKDRYPDRIIFGVDSDSELLRSRMNKRVDLMFQTGFEAEVQKLLDQGYGEALQSMGALGYRFVAQVCRGEMKREEAIELLKKSTWQYGRRQRTWFRAIDEIRWLNAPITKEDFESCVDLCLAQSEGEK